jgi:hypothetical protein
MINKAMFNLLTPGTGIPGTVNSTLINTEQSEVPESSSNSLAEIMCLHNRLNPKKSSLFKCITKVRHVICSVERLLINT